MLARYIKSEKLNGSSTTVAVRGAVVLVGDNSIIVNNTHYVTYFALWYNQTTDSNSPLILAGNDTSASFMLKSRDFNLTSKFCQRYIIVQLTHSLYSREVRGQHMVLFAHAATLLQTTHYFTMLTCTRSHTAQNHILHKITYCTRSHTAQNHILHKITYCTRSHTAQDHILRSEVRHVPWTVQTYRLTDDAYLPP